MSRAYPVSPIVPRPAGDTAAYLRVSTEQQAGEHRSSPREQLRAVTDRARAIGRTLDAALVFQDLGVSGATAEGRPGFMELVAYCEAHPRPRSAPGIVLVLNDSRFGRFDDPEEATHWRFVLKRLGWIVRFCEGDDVEDGVARGVMRFIGSAQASEYRQNLKRTARRASRATAEQGRWQNRAPMGFRRLAVRGDGHERVLEGSQRKAEDEIVKLTLGPADELAIVQYCFQAYAAGSVSLSGLARELLQRWPGRQWSQNTVNAMLKNPAYAGDVVWCRRPHDAIERSETWIRPADQWVTVRDAHPAIVSRALFNQVQQRLAGNRRATRATSGGYPLSGMIRCAVCDDRFVGGGGRTGPAEDPDRWRKYQEAGCTRALYATRCPGKIPTLAKRWLEPRVVAAVAAVAQDPRVQAVIAEELDRALDAALGDSTDRVGALRQEKEKLARQRKRLVDAIAAGVLLEREASTSLVELRKRIDGVEAELERTSFSTRRVSGAAEIRDRVLATATDFTKLASKATGPELRELLRPWLQDAVFDKRSYTLTLTIRKVPNIMGADGTVLESRIRRARDTRDQYSRRDLVVVRKLKVPRRRAG
jgi:DNA invertase Pin-like site-specific DNA recombinase